MPEFRFTLPTVPPYSISPNSRAHWGGQYRIKEKIKLATAMAYRAERNALTVPFEVTPPVELDYHVFHGYRARFRDDDNIRAVFKCVQDQLAEELGINDKHVTVRSVTQDKDRTVEKTGYVEIVIRWSDDSP